MNHETLNSLNNLIPACDIINKGANRKVKRKKKKFVNLLQKSLKYCKPV